MVFNISALRVANLLGSATDRSPAYLGLADGLRLLISDGRITVGTRMPSERELTVQLGVSRTTVSRAYAVLRERGFLVSRQGSGSVTQLPIAPGGSHDHLLAPGDFADSIDLTCAAPAAPPGVAQAYEAAVAELPAFLGGTGYFPSGLPVLREAIARRYDERGLPTSPDQIVVTAGALAAMAITTRALTGPGDRVLLESPTYPNVIGTLRRSGARLVGVGVDPTGWDIEMFRATVRQASPRVAYLIPDFHNPTGTLMPSDQRAALGAALDAARTTAIIDESLVEVAVDDVDMPAPMAAHTRDSISIGSASKEFWGGLRIGWLRASPERVGALVSSRLSLDLGASLLEQLVLTHLFKLRDEVRTHRRGQLTESRRVLSEGLHRHLPEWRHVPPRGGLALWCELPEPLSSALATAAERQGVRLAPGPAFAPEGGLESFIRLPYTKQAEELDVAVQRLAVAWEDAKRHRTATAGRSPLVA
jgi:DNA-binding transcriptional MocR family regulator